MLFYNFKFPIFLQEDHKATIQATDDTRPLSPRKSGEIAGSAALFRKGHPFTLRPEGHTDEMLFARPKEMMELDELPPVSEGHGSKHAFLRVISFPARPCAYILNLNNFTSILIL